MYSGVAYRVVYLLVGTYLQVGTLSFIREYKFYTTLSIAE